MPKYSLRKKAEFDRNILQAIASEANVSLGLAELLVLREIDTPLKVGEFLYADEKSFHDPFLLTDMQKSVNLIKSAITAKDRICIYGDYDVDGVCSTSILYLTLMHLGANVFYYIPIRHDEGYGLNENAITKIAKDNTSLLITVDCGISSIVEVDHAKKLGLNVIITDHHQCPELLPAADCIISAKRIENVYPCDMLCGAGIAFKLSQALTSIEKSLEYVDLAALATVADIVPLRGENRLITKLGLQKMNSDPSLGIRSLIKVASLSDKVINAGHLGFQLGPRVNAGGRMDSSMKTVMMLTTMDEKIADDIANRLNEDNENRKNECDRVINQAIIKAEIEIDFTSSKAIVCWDENWNLGVLGIAASKLVEKYCRPVILLSKSEKKWHGSGRSVSGLDLYSAINMSSEHLLGFGGHPMAAGLSVSEENLEKFRSEFVNVVNDCLPDSELIPVIKYDLALDVATLTQDFTKELELLAPTGMGNPKPVFIGEGIRVLSPKTMGRDGTHFRASILKNDRSINAVGFSQSPPHNDGFFDMIVEPQINSYAGQESLQVVIKDYTQVFSSVQFSIIDKSIFINNLMENFALKRDVIKKINIADKSDLSNIIMNLKKHLGTAILVNTPKDANHLLGLIQKFDKRDYFTYEVGGNKHTIPGQNIVLLSPLLTRDKLLGYNNVIMLGDMYCDQLISNLFSDLPTDRFTVIIDDNTKKAFLGVTKDINLNRSDFSEVYRLLIQKAKSGRYFKSDAALYKELVRETGLSLGIISCIVAVFTELGFLVINKKSPVIILSEPRVKRNLTESILYNELYDFGIVL